MPPELINRANEILTQLEKKNETSGNVKSVSSISNSLKSMSAPQVQLSIFDAHSATFEEIRILLESVDINRLTPVEALLKLQEIKSKIH